MKNILKWFMNGVIVIAPIGITLYLFVYLFLVVDGFGKKILSAFSIPYYTGVGVVLTLCLILLVGFLSQLWVSRHIIIFTEKFITRFPGLKTIYSMVKETIESFIGEKRSFSQVVIVTDKHDFKQIGFLTSENVTGFMLPTDYVAVYIPLGMQLAGELRLYKKDQVELSDIPVDIAMRFCLTAGVSGSKLK